MSTFFNHWHEILDRLDGPNAILSGMERSVNLTDSGKRVEARLENETIVGTTEGLEANGALRIRGEDGGLRVIHSGDVLQVREDSH